MLKLQDHYDWIVMGDHPAVLLSASLAARLGLSVLILPLASHMGLSVTQTGHHFDPESNYMIGLGSSGKLEGLISSCFTKLGILPAEWKLIESLENGPQVITPRARLSLVPNENLQSELYREFGKAVTKNLGLVNALKHAEDEYLTFWHSLPKRLTLSSNRKPSSEEPMTLRHLQLKLAKSLNLTDPALKTWVSRRRRVSDLAYSGAASDLTEVCAGLWHGITLGVNEDPTMFDLLHMLSLSRTGASFRGGMTAYREFLINLARRLGVHVPLKTECRRIFVESGRFAGVQVTSRGNMIVAGGGVLGCSLGKAHERIVFTGRNWFLRKKKPLAPSGWKFTIAFTVHQEAIPNGLLSRSVWQEKGAPVLEIEVVNPETYNVAKSDYRLIFLRTLMPYRLESLKVEYQRLIAGRMTRQLMEIMPFLEFHVTQIYPDFRTGGGLKPSFGMMNEKAEKKEVEEVEEDELLEVYRFNSLEAIPDNLLFYQGKGLGSSSGIENLLLASDESYPELGNLGPTLASLESVAWLAHRSGLAGPFV